MSLFKWIIYRHQYVSVYYMVIVLLCVLHTSMTSGVRNQRFYEVNSSKLGIIPLNNTTRSNSMLQCSFNCLSNSNYCQHFLFYKDRRLCLLSSDLGSAGIKPSAGQHMYSLWTLYCDVSLGYNSTIMKMYSLCLYVSNSEVTFDSARADCTNRQGSLVMVKSISKKLIVLEIMNSSGISDSWIGLDDIQTEGVWTWSDGAVLTSSEMRIPFCSVQPDNYTDDEDCVVMMSYYSCGNDIPCSRIRRYVCEYQH
ncbi:C-type lectin domain 4 member M [Bulinus truncatus]|nr:C-type lectin domain 4 member M [Bulinus truncatus]